METKYYTPEIKELHIGFHYEYNDLGSDGNELMDKWNKLVIKCGTQIDDITREYRTEPVYLLRVKHLERENIESFGFSFSYSWNEREIYDEYKFKNGSLEHWHKTNTIVIHSDGYDRVGSFIGTIKNKNEFERLLKQLNIIKDGETEV